MRNLKKNRKIVYSTQFAVRELLQLYSAAQGGSVGYFCQRYDRVKRDGFDLCCCFFINVFLFHDESYVQAVSILKCVFTFTRYDLDVLWGCITNKYVK